MDGHKELHDQIRNVPGAFDNLKRGAAKLRSLSSSVKISARCVIHRYNFLHWDKIIFTAREAGFDQISFLPADISSEAFNRDQPWTADRQADVLISRNQLPELLEMINTLKNVFRAEFESGFIAENPEKISRIHSYYSAQHGINEFPLKSCNAPWVSAVIEADGSVRPCFFHDKIGSIHQQSLDDIINSSDTIRYRRELDVRKNATCKKCVCSLNLGARKSSY